VGIVSAVVARVVMSTVVSGSRRQVGNIYAPLNLDVYFVGWLVRVVMAP
jgi:hypothetical protein